MVRLWIKEKPRACSATQYVFLQYQVKEFDDNAVDNAFPTKSCTPNSTTAQGIRNREECTHRVNYLSCFDLACTTGHGLYSMIHLFYFYQHTDLLNFMLLLLVHFCAQAKDKRLPNNVAVDNTVNMN
jgi:hypothetical protein